jgi:hypothetical protein
MYLAGWLSMKRPEEEELCSAGNIRAEDLTLAIVAGRGIAWPRWIKATQIKLNASQTTWERCLTILQTAHFKMKALFRNCSSEIGELCSSFFINKHKNLRPFMNRAETEIRPEFSASKDGTAKAKFKEKAQLY